MYKRVPVQSTLAPSQQPLECQALFLPLWEPCYSHTSRVHAAVPSLLTCSTDPMVLVPGGIGLCPCYPAITTCFAGEGGSNQEPP